MCNVPTTKRPSLTPSWFNIAVKTQRIAAKNRPASVQSAPRGDMSRSRALREQDRKGQQDSMPHDHG
eukprot:1416791-Rhodomonas_salina.1